MNRFGFFLKTLEALRAELQEQGGDLLVFDRGPEDAFPKLFLYLQKCQVKLPARITYNRDYEPFARTRDAKMERLFSDWGIEFQSARDHLLMEPGEIKKAVGSPHSKPKNEYYSVYSPFAKKWFVQLGSTEILKRISGSKDSPFGRMNLTWTELFESFDLPEDHLKSFQISNDKKLTIQLPQAGTHAARAVLRSFKKKLEAYNHDRDFPSVSGTSHFSIYLKNGSLTSAQIIDELGLASQRFNESSGATQFLKEIAWREFYYQILWFRPDVETDAFQAKYSKLKWKNEESWFNAWVNGRTGYPIVDAGMRQLATTGWMHNRVRMIVASFLCKDLLIDYRLGERLFMERLLDGDLAPNNGGWQWAASTGCDPQPYFRIFNPELQSRKFDAQGDYIRKYVSELKHLSSERIHCPTVENRRQYVPPIVHHSERKAFALELFKKESVK